ncbi:hypothetical protein V8G69_01715 [Gaetbulibacter sp. M235]|uniref:hypothetical protein n=1 Tax=Gaetbulibacter sp. M235 TaxID=3126510 RepID=UPI00374ED55B
MKNLYALVFISILVLSCSSDNGNDDNIIGKWQIIERYESGVSVDIGCGEYFYNEFNSNHNFVGGYIDFDSTPIDCKENANFTSEKWSKKSDNLYEIYNSLNEVRLRAYFEGENLVIEFVELPYRLVHKKL